MQAIRNATAGPVQSTENAWNIQHWTGTEVALRPDANVQNAPEIGQLYAMPNDLRYAFNEFHRERTNAQAVFQFAPSDAWEITADYTFGTNGSRRTAASRLSG